MSLSASPFRQAKALIPTLEKSLHKGQAGRIGIVGGSAEYTGAPYYAAISALRCGADLSFVFCGESAATIPIKSYSPELIVYPSMSFLHTHLTRLTVIVFGPGLGREENVLNQTKEAILAARKLSVPIVLDGDALWLLKDEPDLIRGYEKTILTPNAMEFERLYETAFKEKPPRIESEQLKSTSPGGVILDLTKEPAISVSKISNWLGGVTVMRKGVFDVISNGKRAVACGSFGSSRRCGGQGDVLAGTCGVFLGWAARLDFSHVDTIAAAYGAALLTRRANSLAFDVERRSMTTPDLIKKIGEAFYDLYDNQSSPWCAL